MKNRKDYILDEIKQEKQKYENHSRILKMLYRFIEFYHIRVKSVKKYENRTNKHRKSSEPNPIIAFEEYENQNNSVG